MLQSLGHSALNLFIDLRNSVAICAAHFFHNRCRQSFDRHLHSMLDRLMQSRIVLRPDQAKRFNGRFRRRGSCFLSRGFCLLHRRRNFRFVPFGSPRDRQNFARVPRRGQRHRCRRRRDGNRDRFFNLLHVWLLAWQRKPVLRGRGVIPDVPRHVEFESDVQKILRLVRPLHPDHGAGDDPRRRGGSSPWDLDRYLQPWQLTITVVVRSIKDSLSASTPCTLIGIACTTRVLRRLSTPVAMVVALFVAPFSEGLMLVAYSSERSVREEQLGPGSDSKTARSATRVPRASRIPNE